MFSSSLSILNHFIVGEACDGTHEFNFSVHVVLLNQVFQSRPVAPPFGRLRPGKLPGVGV